MINLHERMLPTLAGVEPATSWSPVGGRIQLSHRSRNFLHEKSNLSGIPSITNFLGLLNYLPLAKTPITVSLLVKVNTGRRAKGNCRLIKTLSRSFRYVRFSMPSNTERRTVGNIAMVRVNRTRFHLCHLRFKKPCKIKGNIIIS